ncbi:ASCH domain-containing protein, partial [Vibrio vulnificus]|uniref:ASCH domain-containing protein n=1 Tax=Vibrio vulnificus TaxID=672 RepID=UPI003ED89366
MRSCLGTSNTNNITPWVHGADTYFCADEHNANLCAELILRGEKRASCSLDYWYSEKGEPMPVVGHLQVVTNWDGIPICIIEMTSVTKKKYSEVTPEFAALEGEG